MTNSEGYFTAPLNCLSFGLFEYMNMDEFGNFTDGYSISYKTRLWIVHEGDSTFVTDWYDVEPDNGVDFDQNNAGVALLSDNFV